MKEPFLVQFITYNSDCLPPLAWFSWWETNEKCDFDLETRRAHLITMSTCERIGHFANWACCVVCEVHFYTSSIFTAALECDARLRICEKTQKNVRDWKEEANSRCMLLMSSSSREIGVDRQQFAFIHNNVQLFTSCSYLSDQNWWNSLLFFFPIWIIGKKSDNHNRFFSNFSWRFLNPNTYFFFLFEL